MPYFSARGFVGSVLFHTAPGKWVTPDQNIPTVTARYKGEERERWSRCPTQPTSDLWIWQWNGLPTWQMPWCEKYVSAPYFLTQLQLNSEQDVCSHTSQGQRSNIKQFESLWDLAYYGCLLSSLCRMRTLTWKCWDTCTNITQRHIQRNIDRDRSHKHPRHTVECIKKVAYVHM